MIDRRRRQRPRPTGGHAAARPFLGHLEPVLAPQPVHPVGPQRVALALEEDPDGAIAVPRILRRQGLHRRHDARIAGDERGHVGRRTIHLDRDAPPGWPRSVEGYSRGHWEGDTLVVRTTHFRAEDPARSVNGRPLLLSRNSRITERFTRVSDTELSYRFTVEDDGLYTRPWTGELSMTRHDGPLYEYGCHEGNHSMLNILRWGR